MHKGLQRHRGHWGDLVQALFFGIATVFGFYTFWYKDVEGPKHSPATLAITPVLEEMGRRGNDVLVRASFSVANESASRVYVPVFWYSVYGHCYTARDLPAGSFSRVTEAAFQPAAPGAPPATLSARFSAPSPGEVVASGRLWNSTRVYFDPKAARRMEEMFLVPADQFDALQIRVDYFLVKDVEDLADPRWEVRGDGALHGQVWLRKDPSRADTASAERLDRTRHAEWRKDHGAGWGWSHASLPLWPAAEGRAARVASTGTQCAPAAGAPSAGPEQMAMRR
ncbi:MAG TPA: hypothetical protein VEW03_03840 [Longimicrobiaceae bacterium]|nr:hypothetical protein [Longimicrobiaceae bacterium]